MAYRAAMLTGATIGLLALIPLFMMKDARAQKGHRRSKAVASEEPPAERKRTRMDMAQFALMGGLMSIGVGMVWPFYNVYLKSLGTSDDQVGYIFALSGLVGAIACLLSPMIVARVGAINSTLVLRLSVVPIFIPLIFFPSLGIAVLGMLWRSGTASIAWPIEVTFISEILPQRARAGVFGLRSSVWNLGYAFATYIGGLLIVSYGYWPSMLSFVVFSTLSAITFYAYFSRQPRVQTGEITTAWSPIRRTRLQAKAARLDADVAESDALASV